MNVTRSAIERLRVNGCVSGGVGIVDISAIDDVLSKKRIVERYGWVAALEAAEPRAGAAGKMTTMAILARGRQDVDSRATQTTRHAGEGSP